MGTGWLEKPVALWVWVNTYRYHYYSGMNIHKSQLFWGEQKGYKVLTHPLMFNLSFNGPVTTWNKLLHSFWEPFGWHSSFPASVIRHEQIPLQ